MPERPNSAAAKPALRSSGSPPGHGGGRASSARSSSFGVPSRSATPSTVEATSAIGFNSSAEASLCSALRRYRPSGASAAGVIITEDSCSSRTTWLTDLPPQVVAGRRTGDECCRCHGRMHASLALSLPMSAACAAWHRLRRIYRGAEVKGKSRGTSTEVPGPCAILQPDPFHLILC